MINYSIMNCLEVASQQYRSQIRKFSNDWQPSCPPYLGTVWRISYPGRSRISWKEERLWRIMFRSNLRRDSGVLVGYREPA